MGHRTIRFCGAAVFFKINEFGSGRSTQCLAANCRNTWRMLDPTLCWAMQYWEIQYTICMGRSSEHKLRLNCFAVVMQKTMITINVFVVCAVSWRSKKRLLFASTRLFIWYGEYLDRLSNSALRTNLCMMCVHINLEGHKNWRCEIRRIQSAMNRLAAHWFWRFQSISWEFYDNWVAQE